MLRNDSNVYYSTLLHIANEPFYGVKVLILISGKALLK